MNVKWLISALCTLALFSGESHAANRCAELLTNFNFSPEFSASAIEGKIDAFKKEPPDAAISYLLGLEQEINAEFRRILREAMAAKRVYHEDFSMIDRINPLQENRKEADGLIDRVDRHLEELGYYDKYVTELVAKMARGQTDFRIFDWRRNYPRTQSADYRPTGLEETRAMELALEKHRQANMADPESVTEMGPGNPPGAISPLNTSHEAIQTDFAAGDTDSYSRPW